MITAVCFLLLAALVPILGGRLSRLAEVRLRAWWAIFLALFIQVLLIEVFAGTFGGILAAAFHLLSYGFALVFVWANRHVTGMAVMVLGGLLNLAAIAANGGVMPAQREALETAGIIVDSPEFENSAVVDDARLWFLGDVFAIPEGIPFANVFSIGDIVLVLGAGITVHTVGRSRLGRLLVRLDPLRRPEPATPEPVSPEAVTPEPVSPEVVSPEPPPDGTPVVAPPTTLVERARQAGLFDRVAAPVVSGAAQPPETAESPSGAATASSQASSSQPSGSATTCGPRV